MRRQRLRRMFATRLLATLRWAPETVGRRCERRPAESIVGSNCEAIVFPLKRFVADFDEGRERLSGADEL